LVSLTGLRPGNRVSYWQTSNYPTRNRVSKQNGLSETRFHAASCFCKTLYSNFQQTKKAIPLRKPPSIPHSFSTKLNYLFTKFEFCLHFFLFILRGAGQAWLAGSVNIAGRIICRFLPADYALHSSPPVLLLFTQVGFLKRNPTKPAIGANVKKVAIIIPSSIILILSFFFM
jgi:hypothetical protein